MLQGLSRLPEAQLYFCKAGTGFHLCAYAAPDLGLLHYCNIAKQDLRPSHYLVQNDLSMPQLTSSKRSHCVLPTLVTRAQGGNRFVGYFGRRLQASNAHAYHWQVLEICSRIAVGFVIHFPLRRSISLRGASIEAAGGCSQQFRSLHLLEYRGSLHLGLSCRMFVHLPHCFNT